MLRFFLPRFRSNVTLLALSALASAAIAAEQLPRLEVSGNPGGSVQIQQSAGAPLLSYSGLQFKWRPAGASKKDPAFAVKTKGGTSREIPGADGSRAVEVDYTVEAPGEQPALKITGRFTPGEGRVDVQFDVAGLPEGAQLDGAIFNRKIGSGIKEIPPGDLGKPGLWQRHAHGGQPVEIPDGKLQPFQFGDRRLYIAQETPAIAAAESTGVFTAKLSILLPPAEWPTEAISAWQHHRPLALHLGTCRAYNWWSDNREPLGLDATLVNTSAEPRKVELTHWVRDFSGKIVSQQKRAVELKPGEALANPIRFKTSAQRDIFFTEVSVADQATGQEIFARTNLTLLPPHVFKSTSADSLFGISAYWPIPDEASVQRVLERMGVRWLRHGNAHNYNGITPIRHTSTPKMEDPQEIEAWLRKQLEICATEGNEWWEFGNEINYTVASIGMGDVVKDEVREQIIRKYIGWLKDIRRLQKETGLTQTKLTTVGIAGMDVKFMEKFVELGGWDLVDGFALHTGRGNFTPDYTGPASYDDWVIGKYGTYWNYYGSMRLARELLKKFGGDKPLWITEAYSPAFPNSFWEDSLRNGAENTLLSLALAKVENVKAVMWYQLFDGVWFDRIGVNPKDREYYFGLINRDLSFKPALLAYCAAAEALDGATFQRWITFKDPATHGLLFNTPRGPMAILWNRADGYTLSQDRENFASPEPWINTWKTRTPTQIPVAGKTAQALNFIGQPETVRAKNGQVTLNLTGAPTILYGIDASKLK